MNIKKLFQVMLLCVMAYLPMSAFAVGAGRGYIYDLKIVPGDTAAPSVMSFKLNTSRTFLDVSGYPQTGYFVVLPTGSCAGIPTPTIVALDISDLSNSITKVSYNILFAAYLMDKPVEMNFGDCGVDSSNSSIIEVKNIKIIAPMNP